MHRTEGWPAGLRLAALFLTRDQPGHAAADFGGDDHAVVEYLAEEVLARHPPTCERFLLRTSVAERLDASLAEALTDEIRSQQHLEDLAASNTFVVGLGPGRTWFRYHALLRQMLRHRLSVESPDVVPDLHRRAARWFSDHGEPLEALRHAAEAQDWGLMGRLLVTQALPLALSAERAGLGLALARIPTQQLASSRGSPWPPRPACSSPTASPTCGPTSPAPRPSWAPATRTSSPAPASRCCSSRWRCRARWVTTTR